MEVFGEGSGFLFEVLEADGQGMCQLGLEICSKVQCSLILTNFVDSSQAGVLCILLL